MEVFKQNRHRIRGIGHLPLRTAATFGEDIKEMMARPLTFEEAVASPDLTLMAKQRLLIIDIDVRKKLRAILNPWRRAFRHGGADRRGREAAQDPA